MYFFAYGTLQPGSNLRYFEDNALSQHLTPSGRGLVNGTLLHLKNLVLGIEYPGLLLDGSEKKIKGTVYTVDDPAVFAIMDAHELYTSKPGSTERIPIDLYYRTDVHVSMDDGTAVTATAYVLNPASSFFASGAIEVKGEVESGDWLSYIKR